MARLIGFGMTLAFAGLVYIILFGLSWGSDPSGSIFIGTFLLPLAIGFATQAIVDPKVQKRYLKLWGYSLIVTAVLSLVLLLIALETVICIVMAAPIFIPFQILGVLLARVILRPLTDHFDPNKVQASVLAVLAGVALVPFDVEFPASYHHVTTTITINAPVEEVWEQTVEIPDIQPEERIWRLSHHILRAPQPVSAEMVDGVRQLRWSKGVRFEEHITARAEYESLAWDFAFPHQESLIAFDPHISPTGPDLVLDRGFYHLTALDADTTVLELTTHYRLHTPIDAYLVWWGELFLNDFHASVLHVIKERAEDAHGQRR